MRDLKVGDKIEMKDASYAFGVCQNTYMEDCHYQDLGVLTVIAVDLQVMKKAKPYYRDSFCDILVTNKEGDYWFVASRLIQLQVHEITIDGKTIEVSDESYENLRKQLL